MFKCTMNAYGEFTPTMPASRAVWPFFDLLFFHRGRVSLILNNTEKFEMLPGQSVLVFPHTIFLAIPTTEKIRMSAHHFRLSDSANEISPLLTELKQKHAGWKIFSQPLPSVEADLNRLIRLAEEQQSNHIDEMRSSLMSLVLNQLYYSETATPPINSRWSELLQWLERSTAQPVTLECMAQRLSISSSHFQALFRQHYGTSPGQYFLKLRMTKAAQLLRGTTMPVKQIAHQLGYTYPQHFHRAFCNHFHQKPGEYRQKYSPKM